MKKNIFVWWSNSRKQKNFGDALNPYIISKLSDLNVVYVALLKTKRRSLCWGIKSMLRSRISIYDFYNVIRSFFKKQVILAIGSIIESYESKKITVWGSGLMNSRGHICQANFLAVRGEYTRKRIIDLGYTPPKILGDPALLLPLVYSPKHDKKYDIGIIPHYLNYNEAIDMFENNNQILIINVFDNVEKVVDDINSCRNTVSSSLHGIIVSHAYGIKSIWGNFSINKLDGDNVKFKDYFSSVKIDIYDPILITDDISNLRESLEQCRGSLPHVDIKLIQMSLLRVAPFEVLSKYLI
jgi:hypothetical protein